MPTGDKIQFLGLNFDSRTVDSAVREIFGAFKGRFKYVVTPNAHHMVLLHENSDQLKQVYEFAWRTFCDSRILSRLATFSGIGLPVVTGSDLTASIVAKASDEQLSVAIIGPSDADCSILNRLYPGLRISVLTPPMGFIFSEAEIKKCIDFVVAVNVPLTFLAVGMPQQEILARRIAEHPDARGVGLCIGASIDFLTGKQKRAPTWMQRAGLEWLYRLLSEPRRLARRYLIESPDLSTCFSCIGGHQRRVNWARSLEPTVVGDELGGPMLEPVQRARERLVLHFHGLGKVPAWVEAEEAAYWCSQARFGQILDDIILLSNKVPIDITLDDGNMSDATIGLPALASRGLRAEFFVTAGRIGQRGYLDNAAIQDLLSGGMAIGSHGWAHVDWRRASDRELDVEVEDARKKLSDIAGTAIDTVAIPFGSYDRRVLRRLRAGEFRTVYTSDGGHARPTEWLMAREVFRTSWDDAKTLTDLAIGPVSTKTILRRHLVGLFKRMR